MGEVMKEAAFSLAEAKFATGDFNQQILQNVSKAQIKVTNNTHFSEYKMFNFWIELN